MISPLLSPITRKQTFIVEPQEAMQRSEVIFTERYSETIGSDLMGWIERFQDNNELNNYSLREIKARLIGWLSGIAADWFRGYKALLTPEAYEALPLVKLISDLVQRFTQVQDVVTTTQEVWNSLKQGPSEESDQFYSQVEKKVRLYARYLLKDQKSEEDTIRTIFLAGLWTELSQ